MRKLAGDGPKKVGFSLLETCLALSMMTVIFIYFAGVMQSTLGFRGRLEVQSQAAHIAQNKIEEIRAWANLKSGGQFQYFQLDHFQNGLQSDPTMPALQTLVTVANHTIASPDSLFELAHQTPPDQRLLHSSVQQITVQVLRDGQQVVSLSSLVREPFRGWSQSQPIQIQPGSATLPKDATQTFTFTAYDQNQQPIADLFCNWNVIPVTGVALISSQARDGSSAVLMNHARHRDGSFFHTGGTCKVTASIVYHGQQRIAMTLPITLAGP